MQILTGKRCLTLSPVAFSSIVVVAGRPKQVSATTDSKSNKMTYANKN